VVLTLVVVVVLGAVVVVTAVVVVVLAAVVVVTAVVVVVLGGAVGCVVGAVVVLVVVGAAVVVVVGAAVVVVELGTAVVVVTGLTELVGKLVDVGAPVVGAELVLGHPEPCPQVGLDVLVGETVVVVKAHGLGPALPVQAVVVLPGAVGREVLVVGDVFDVVGVVVVDPGGRFVVLVVLFVVVVFVVLAGLVVLVVLLVVVVVVVGTGRTAELADAFVGSPKYTQDTSTIGDGQPTGQANFTGKSATPASGAETVQPFFPVTLADTCQSVPAGSPVPA
jgi:hypothetical protein